MSMPEQPVDEETLLRQRYEQNMAALAQANPLLAARIAHDVATRGWDTVTKNDVAQAGNFGPDIAAYLSTKGG